MVRHCIVWCCMVRCLHAYTSVHVCIPAAVFIPVQAVGYALYSGNKCVFQHG